MGRVLLSRGWVVGQAVAWAAHFRRLALDPKRLPKALVGLGFLAFAILALRHFFHLMAQGP